MYETEMGLLRNGVGIERTGYKIWCAALDMIRSHASLLYYTYFHTGEVRF